MDRAENSDQQHTDNRETPNIVSRYKLVELIAQCDLAATEPLDAVNTLAGDSQGNWNMSQTIVNRSIPRTVWALGFVSLFMDLSSEMVHSLLPMFLVGSLGVSMITLGLIEGIAEATALIVKVFSGAISDYFGRRKGLLLVGYGLAALTKPLFPLAHSAEMVFTARFLDRIGKGIPGAPRDAQVADVSPQHIRRLLRLTSIHGYDRGLPRASSSHPPDVCLQ